MQISHLNPQNLVLDSDGKRGWSNDLFGSIGECAASRFSGPHSFFWSDPTDPQHLSQFSRLAYVPASSTPIPIPGFTISPSMDLPIQMGMRPAVAIVSGMLSLAAALFPVFCKFVLPWSPVSAVG